MRGFSLQTNLGKASVFDKSSTSANPNLFKQDLPVSRAPCANRVHAVWGDMFWRGILLASALLIQDLANLCGERLALWIVSDQLDLLHAIHSDTEFYGAGDLGQLEDRALLDFGRRSEVAQDGHPHRVHRHPVDPAQAN